MASEGRAESRRTLVTVLSAALSVYLYSVGFFLGSRGAPDLAASVAAAAPSVGDLAFPLAEGVQLPDGGSHFEITSIVIVRFVPTPDVNVSASSDIIDAGCVKFVNDDARTANRVLVRLSYRSIAH